ncbi:hypothetical protein [Prosthecobacter sp.]|uniref:hypothetical protein n=1 Tax=Prosthecobacter sp. TaxID=1965333 RepID=UPI001E0014ED|nr:hypothetical protein [Prosthecobacter sp.]MCB1279715.1 hypothetical protein [Prosthecobacter sp.]
MSSWIALFTAVVCLLALPACETPVQRAERVKQERFLQVKRPAMAEKIIEDVVDLPEEEKPSMWDIAQTFPAYDWSINAFHRDGLTKVADDHFLLEGDSSQPPVEIKQTSEKPPLKVEVAIGPIHDGFGFRVPKLHYTFKRIDGGWKRLKWNVTYHGPARGDGEEEPPLNEQENREKIEKITGKPYVDEVELASAESPVM